MIKNIRSIRTSHDSRHMGVIEHLYKYSISSIYNTLIYVNLTILRHLNRHYAG